MHVEHFELFEVPPRWLFLRLVTDEGTTGWGEAVIEGRNKTVRAAAEELIEQYILGNDPFSIKDHWQAMYRGGFYRGGPILMSAIGGIDQALWDIKGKSLDVPVFELLGGKVRDKIHVYQWAGGDRPEDVCREASELVDAGYTSIKIDATDRLSHDDPPKSTAEIIERVEAVRQTIGDGINLSVDFRGRVEKPMVRRLVERLGKYDLKFIEEPLPPEYTHMVGDILAHSSTPIALGERLYSRWDYKDVFSENSIDIIQPSVARAGGITEVVRIATMAEAHDMAVAPNCPMGPIAVAASTHVSSVIPNFLVQDHGFVTPDNIGASAHGYIQNPAVFNIDSGYIRPPDRPGLGLQLNEEVIEEKASQDINTQISLSRYADGSVAEW